MKKSEKLRSNGIIQRLTMPYTPEQNGVSERGNRTLLETARTLMHAHGDLSKALCAELINTAAYLLNGPVAIKVDGSSSKARSQIYGILESNEAHAFPTYQNKKERNQIRIGVLVGYDNDDGYRVWAADNFRYIIRSKDVIFYEKILNSHE